MVRVALLVAFFAFVQDPQPQGQPQPQPQQEPPKPPENPHKNLPHAQTLEKCMQYLKTKADRSDPGVMCYIGWAFLLDGREEFKPALNGIIQRAKTSCLEQKHFNGNWHMALAILFLAEVYKRQPDDGIKDALKEAVKAAAKTMEPTGGWCHRKGYARESGYDKKGGGVDICMLTATMVAAMMNVRAAGIDPCDGPINNGINNLKQLSRGGGLAYGTGNPVGDKAGARGAMLAYALWLGKQTQDPFFGNVARSLPGMFGQAQTGHASGGQNFFALALGSYAIGQYQNFVATWLGKLPVKANGEVTMLADGSRDLNFGGGHLMDTAVYCMMILMQHPKILEEHGPAPAAGGNAPEPEKKPSPFSQKK
jgi:hypothetical protein